MENTKGPVSGPFALGALSPLAPGSCHRSHQIPEVPFLVVQEGGVTRVYPQRGHERMLMCERVPAERREVEDEALW
jgi:hypothetical protein